jgi:tetratricopeptide (TPR) repeat protein
VAEPQLASNELRETAESLTQMRRGLLMARGSFSLYIAVSNSPRRSRELIRLLADAVPGIEVVELEPGVEEPLAAVVERAEPEASGPLMVLGLERSLSTDEETAPVLRVLNMQRERWPEALRRPVVLWVPDFFLALLGRSAPDFLDWRSGTFFFGEEEGDGAHNALRSMDAAAWKGGLDEGLPESDRRRRIEELRSRLASTAETSDRVVRGARTRWLHEFGIHLWRLGEWKEAEGRFREAAALAEELDDPAARAATYHQLGILAQERGDYDDALEWNRKSLAIKEERGDRARMAISYHQLGRIAEERGDYDDALDWYRKSLAILEQIGDRARMAISYHQLGMIAQRRGDYEEAVDWYRRSFAIFEGLDNRAGMASSYHQLGMIAEQRGAYDDALDWYRKSLAIAEEIGNRAGMAPTLSQIGVLWTERGEPETAVPLNLRSLSLRLELGVPQVRIDLHWLRRQRDLLGENRFWEIVEREGTIERGRLARLLDEAEQPETQPTASPAAPPAA